MVSSRTHALTDYLFPALTAALARWLDDDAGRAAAGQAARAHVSANHAIEGEARAIVDVYRSLL